MVGTGSTNGRQPQQQRCEEVSQKTLIALFEELNKLGVLIEGTILKTNMVCPAKNQARMCLRRM